MAVKARQDQPRTMRCWRSHLLMGIPLAAASVLTLAAVGPGLGLAWAVLFCLLWSAPFLVRMQPAAAAGLLPLVAAPALGSPSGAWIAAGLALAGLAATALLSADRLAAGDAATTGTPLARHRDLLRDHLDRYPQLLETCLQLASARDLSELGTFLANAALGARPHADLVRVYLGSADRLHLVAETGNHDACLPLIEDRDALVTYVATEARSLVRRRDDRVLVAVPLRGDRRGRSGKNATSIRGCLLVIFPGSGSDDHLAIDLIKALARLGGLALASVALLADAQALAYHDDLTGLFGRAEFLHRLREQIGTCRRNRQELGLLMCDLDHLKQFNDRHGHAAGDQALRHVAQAIQTALDRNAFACRYGGEEFMAALPGADRTVVARVADAIHHAIRSQSPLGDQDARVTASLGWALLRPDESEEQILKRADEACYRAKDAGRDRVVEAL